jgi:hypothetical protein
VSDIVTSYNYLADREWQEQGPAAALELLDEASDLADRRGAFSQGSWTKVAALELLSELGRWDELLERAEPLAAETRLDESLQVSIALWMSAVHLNRRESTVDMEELLERARFVEDLQVLAPALVMAARAAVRAGDPDRALALLREFDEQTAGKAAMYRTALAPGTVRLLVEVGSLDLAAGVVSRSEAVTMRDALFVDTAEAIVRRAQGAREPEAWVALEERWRAYGDPFEEAHAALALGDVISDETVTARGRVLLDKLGVPA